MSYPLDGQSREIYEGIVLIMPKSGSYKLDVYCYDRSGWDYWFGYLTFSISFSEKITVMFYASDAGGINGDSIYSKQAGFYNIFLHINK